jgi:CRP-like cAMP-binding protein
VLENNWIF